MSNEYKDWLMDNAQDFLLDTDLLYKITKCEAKDDGYYISGIDHFDHKLTYFVYGDKDGFWQYREIVE